MSDLVVPEDVENSVLSIGLNSTILLVFLMGMYTIIYCGTLYVYLAKNAANRRLVPATITILFLTNIVQTGVQWYLTKWQFIDNGDTRDSAFLASFNFPQWATLAADISTYLGFVLADGLLIWRCYNVWNYSIRIISVPLLLIITEAGLYLAQIIIHIIFTDLTISQAQETRFNNMLAAAYFLSFGTSLVTTILIAYRIYAVLKQKGAFARKFKHILDIVVQSGLLYSLSLFVAAISSIAPSTGLAFNTTILALQEYTQNLIVPITGISTTILVARVAMLAPDATLPSTSVHLSGLQFNVHSTQHTDNREGMAPSNRTAINSSFVGEGQGVTDKVQ